MRTIKKPDAVVRGDHASEPVAKYYFKIRRNSSTHPTPSLLLHRSRGVRLSAHTPPVADLESHPKQRAHTLESAPQVAHLCNETFSDHRQWEMPLVSNAAAGVLVVPLLLHRKETNHV